jgi:hypothetical protein
VAGHCWDAAEVGQLAAGADPDELAHLVIAIMEGMLVLAVVSDSDVAAMSAAEHRLLPRQRLQCLIGALAREQLMNPWPRPRGGDNRLKSGWVPIAGGRRRPAIRRRLTRATLTTG